MIDEKGNGDRISQSELRKRIHIINPSFPMSELGTLTNNKTELKAKELYDMLKDNELDNFDPLENLLNRGPDFIFEISIHFSNDTTGQYCELSK